MVNTTYNKQFTTSKNEVKFTTNPGKTIQDIVNVSGCPVALQNSLRVYIGDRIILQKYWGLVRPKEGANVRLILIPQGGDNGILRMVAAMAIAIASQGAGAAYAGGPLSAATGGAYWGGLAITVGTAMVGMLALNAIFPPPPDPSGPEEGKTLKSITGTRNASPAGNVVPRVYGRMRMYPPYGAMPYVTTEAGVQFLHALFDLGYGPLNLSDLKIGGTPIDSYSEISYNIHQSITDSTDLEYFTQDVDSESVNVNLEDGGPAIARTSSTETIQIALDLSMPGGLISYNTEGDKSFESVTFRITLKDSGSVIVPTSNWNIGYYTPSSAGINHIDNANYRDVTITATDEDAFNFAVTLSNFVTGLYTVEVERISSTNNGQTQVNTMSYLGIRSNRNSVPFESFRKYDGVNRIPHTMVEIKVRATDQLSGTIDSFNCIAESVLRVWNGTSFVNQATSNPAWIMVDVLTGTLNQRPKPDSRLNLVELKAWADRCDELVNGNPRHTCNFILSDRTTLLNLLKEIASCGRASLDIFDDMYSVIYEHPQTQKVQLFTNMNTWNFSSSRSYTEMPHAIKIDFLDSENNWEPRERVVYTDGYSEANATKFEYIKTKMITSQEEAYRLGRYWIKEAELRRETITINCDLDWLDCKRGDLVGVQMDVMKTGGSTARVIDVSGTVVTLDEPANRNNVSVSYFELRPSDGNVINGPVAFFNAGSPNTVDIGISLAQIGDLIVFNEAGQESYDCLVKQIDVNQDLTATVTLVEHAPAVLDVDSEVPDSYDPKIGRAPAIHSRPAPVVKLSAKETINFVDSKPYATITLSWEPDDGVAPIVYYIYKQDTDTGEWIFEGNSTFTNFVWGKNLLAINSPIIGVSQIFSVVGVSVDGEHIPPASGSQVSIAPTGDTTIPPDPDYFVVEDTAENFRRFWWGYDKTEAPADLAGFVIKYTRSTLQDWGSASPLHDGVLVNPPFEIRALPQGTQTVIIRAIDTSGNLSTIGKKITFVLGDRIVENVLFTNEFAPAWNGSAVVGSPIIDGSNRLSADTTTSGLMWSATPSDLMWVDDSALMWVSPNDGFDWITNITVPAGGISNINWAGDGEVQLYYGAGTYPQDFELFVEDATFTPAYLNTSPLVSDPAWLGAAARGTTTLQDTSVTSAQNAYEQLKSGTAVNNEQITFSVKFPKQSLAYPFMIGPRWWGATPSVEPYLAFDTNTGELHIYSGSPDSYGVVDLDTHWLLWITGSNNAVGNTNLSFFMWPSFVDSSWVASASYMQDVEVTEVYAVAGTIPYGFKGAGELLYRGNGQGVIPYTSPVHLDAGDYFVSVHSPKSVDVNRLSSLEWVTDVPDINEVFDDEVVSATGDTVINLTKNFTAIKNVSIVLQDDGNNAATCRIISKMTSAITVRCYNSSDTQVQGLIDMRVQGY